MIAHKGRQHQDITGIKEYVKGHREQASCSPAQISALSSGTPDWGRRIGGTSLGR
ncbi:hypothetical protein [uncultured Cohaesibacter sp.]|uniref:hypothetical protein n=1 Tax=uncultured Cohaesibacter sp. TaxID=1002546 RepID=UPI002930CFB8